MNLSFIENVTDNVFNKANASVNLNEGKLMHFI